MRGKVIWKMMILILFVSVNSTLLYAQKMDINPQAAKISCPEKRWAVFHPFVAKRSYRISKSVLHAADSIKSTSILDGDINSGQVDAFKHTYWMAFLTQHIKFRKALKLGKAHEKGNYKSYKKSVRKGLHTSHDKVSSEMDLWNNQKGVEIGNVLNGKNLIVIQQAIIDSVLSGKMKIISKNASGQFLDCEGNVIPKDHLDGKWENGKCLVPSDKVVNR